MFEKEKGLQWFDENSNAVAFCVFLDMDSWNDLKDKAPNCDGALLTIPVGKSYFWQVARQQCLLPLQTYNC